MSSFTTPLQRSRTQPRESTRTVHSMQASLRPTALPRSRTACALFASAGGALLAPSPPTSRINQCGAGRNGPLKAKDRWLQQLEASIRRPSPVAAERKRAVGCARAAAMHKRVALMALAGLCLGSASAFQPQARLVRRAVAGPCASASRRAPPLRVAMQFQSREAGTSTQRRSSFQMPKTNPISSRREPEGPLEDDPSLPMVEDIIRALDDRKAQGIWAVRVAHLTYSTEFFINCHGTSRPMLQAIAGSVEDTMLEKYDRPIKWQGNPDSGWILLDYGEVIVNIMTEQAREFYDLEDHWSNGELVPLQGLVTPMDAFESQVQRRGVLARVRPCQCVRRLVWVCARTHAHTCARPNSARTTDALLDTYACAHTQRLAAAFDFIYLHTHARARARAHTHTQRLAAAFDFVDDEDWSAGGVDPFAEWDKLDADVDDAPL